MPYNTERNKVKSAGKEESRGICREAITCGIAMTHKRKLRTRGRMVSNDKCKNILGLGHNNIFISVFILKALNINENTSLFDEVIIAMILTHDPYFLSLKTVFSVLSL